MPEPDRKGGAGLLVFVAVASLATGVGHTGPAGFANLPIQFALKDGLGSTPAAVALFFAISALPWYLKPLASMVTDTVPLFGQRRRSYVLIAALTAAIAWLALLVVPPSYWMLLIVVVALESAIAMSSAVLGGVLVEAGRARSKTGGLTSLRLAVIFIAGVAAAPVGGWLATRPLPNTAIVGVGLQLMLFTIAVLALHEPPKVATSRSLTEVVRRGLRALTSKPVLVVGAIGFLALVAPGFGTPLFYVQTERLGHSAQFVGLTRMGATAAAGLAALGYGIACRYISVRRLLDLGIVAHAASALLFLVLGPADWTAIAIISIYGGCSALLVLPLWHISARVAPPGFESLAYALMMSVLNLAQSSSDVLGSVLVERWQAGFSGLVWVNSATTLAILLLAPLLPPLIMGVSDRAPNPRPRA